MLSNIEKISILNNQILFNEGLLKTAQSQQNTQDLFIYINDLKRKIKALNDEKNKLANIL